MPRMPRDLGSGRAACAVGIVGAGQLARMTIEAASALGLHVVVLARDEADCAVRLATQTIFGSPDDPDALAALARRSSVVTFDHEQVDVDLVASLEQRGVRVHPGSETLRVAVDKAVMRRHLEAHGLPVPPYRVLGVPGVASTIPAAADAIEEFARRHGRPVVLKAARGGYDGKGVWTIEDAAGARDACERAAANGTPLLVESCVPVDRELAVVVARCEDGDSVAWPAVETTQVEGVCREVLYPGTLLPGLRDRAESLAARVAAAVHAVGVLAVELFAVGDELLVNEIAARPHNSAHWTIEGARTSQFENHVRVVLGLPLGDTAAIHAHVASVNVFGPPGAGEPEPAAPGEKTGFGELAGALAVPGVHVHLYGKEPRPGRKLGHVTACGDDPADVRSRAWAAARALGTPVPGGAGLDARHAGV